MIDTLFAPKVKEYIVRGMQYLANNEPGKLESYARENRDIVKELADRYIPLLSKVDKNTINLIRVTIRYLDMPSFSNHVAADLVKDLESRDGELKCIAQQYPDWLRDQVRRAINLCALNLLKGG